jgi:TRAP-type C4-dicarboxylate transport system permease small subunit
MGLIKKTQTAFEKAINFLASLASLLIFLIVMAISFSVATRFLFQISWVGLVELSAMSLLFITFMGTTWVLRRNGHTTMDFVIKQFSTRSQAFINMITSMTCALICLVLVWYGTEVAWSRFLKGTYLFSHVNIPDAYFLFIIPVGSFFLFVQFLIRTYGYLKSWRHPEEPETTN